CLTEYTGHSACEGGSPQGARIVDIRLPFDAILALTARPQRLPRRPNVTEVLLSRWRLDHSATHDELSATPER
ncbi:MAG TPA: hypothetical protein VF926_14650, partial [Mycobacterium sp.]